MNQQRSDTRRAVLAALDPLRIAVGLGLKPDKRARHVYVCCPVHGERTPSMVLRPSGGSVLVKCFGCGWKGDGLALIAAVEGLGSFPETLARAAEMAGLAGEANEIRGGSPVVRRSPLPPPPQPEPDATYPEPRDVDLLWSACVPANQDPEATAMLVRRRMDPDAIARLDLARVLAANTHWSSVPRWARYKGRLERTTPWLETGHRLIVPVYDPAGAMRSVRAWLVRQDERLPKRVPPSGHRAGGLVLANPRARRWLLGETSPSSLVFVEGEPDFVVRSIAFPNETIVGIGSGSWTDEFAERVPYGSEVCILTHLDGAGERYAEKIAKSVARRAQVFRWTLDSEETAA